MSRGLSLLPSGSPHSAASILLPSCFFCSIQLPPSPDNQASRKAGPTSAGRAHREPPGPAVHTPISFLSSSRSGQRSPSLGRAQPSGTRPGQCFASPIRRGNREALSVPVLGRTAPSLPHLRVGGSSPGSALLTEGAKTLGERTQLLRGFLLPSADICGDPDHDQDAKTGRRQGPCDPSRKQSDRSLAKPLIGIRASAKERERGREKERTEQRHAGRGGMGPVRAAPGAGAPQIQTEEEATERRLMLIPRRHDPILNLLC